MPYEMRLFEDTLFGGEEVRFEDPAPRAIYGSAGSISVNGEDVPLDGGVVSTDAAKVRAGHDGATVWRSEVRSSTVGADAYGRRTTLRLSGRIDTEGRSSSYCPGGAWFERGPEPVFAQASIDVPSRFVRMSTAAELFASAPADGPSRRSV